MTDSQTTSDTDTVAAKVAAANKTAEDNNVITGPKPVRKPRKSNVVSNDDGVIGSRAAEKPAKDPAPDVVEEVASNKVALRSQRNMRWQGVGSLEKGLNIVTKEAAEKWLTRPGVYEATPQEVAAHFGK